MLKKIEIRDILRSVHTARREELFSIRDAGPGAILCTELGQEHGAPAAAIGALGWLGGGSLGGLAGDRIWSSQAAFLDAADGYA